MSRTYAHMPTARFRLENRPNTPTHGRVDYCHVGINTRLVSKTKRDRLTLINTLSTIRTLRDARRANG